jgi:ribokinase
MTMRSLPSAGETVIGTSISRVPGGKGANQAVAAARAGAQVVFVSAVGADSAGEQATASLTAEGIDWSPTEIHFDQPTGSAAVFVSDDGENLIAIVLGANAALTPEAVRRALTGRGIGPGDVCLVSFEIEDDAATAAATCSYEHGAQLLVNPAPARPMTQAMLDAHPVLLPNRSELEALSGAGGMVGARRLHALTGEPVVVTVGGDGALMVGSGADRRFAAVPVDVVDTTGAGDTFAGVLAARLALGETLDESVRYAVVGAGLSVEKAGARAGSPTAAQIEESLSSVKW